MMKNYFGNLKSIWFIPLFAFGCTTDEMAPILNEETENINHLEFDPSEIDTRYNRELKITDETGKYSVIANLGSNDEGLIEHHLDVTEFKLNLIYGSETISEKSGEEKSQIQEINEMGGGYTMKFKELNLDEKSIGFSIDVIYNQDKLANSRLQAWSYTLDHDSPDNWMYWGKVEHKPTNNTNNDVMVMWYYRSCSTCSMSFDWSQIIGPNGVSTYHRSGERRIRAKVRSNWKNYRVFFKKWENDSWDEIPVI